MKETPHLLKLLTIIIMRVICHIVFIAEHNKETNCCATVATRHSTIIPPNIKTINVNHFIVQTDKVSMQKLLKTMVQFSFRIIQHAFTDNTKSGHAESNKQPVGRKVDTQRLVENTGAIRQCYF
jgi:hypothetical protein